MFYHLLQYNALLEAKQLRVGLAQGEVVFCDKCGDDRIVVKVKAGEDVGDQVVIVDRLGGGGHLIAQGVHFVDVVANGESIILCGHMCDLGVDGASFCCRCEVFFNNGPGFYRGATPATWERISFVMEDSRKPRTCWTVIDYEWKDGLGTSSSWPSESFS